MDRFDADRRSDRAGNREALQAFENVLRHEEKGGEDEDETHMRPLLGEDGVVSISRAGRRRKRVRRFGQDNEGEEDGEGEEEAEEEERLEEERAQRKRQKRVVALESEDEEGDEDEEYEAEAVSDGEDEHMA